MEYLYIICIGLLVFFSVSLLAKKNKPLSERIFSYWIILLIITVASFLLYVKGQARVFPLFITIVCDSHLLHGAILYLYVRAFTDSRFRLRPVHLWHLTPVLIQVGVKLLLNFTFGKMECYREGGCVEDDNIWVTLTYIYKYLVLGAYILAAWKVVNGYRKTALSPRDQMRVQWVRQIVQGVTFLYFGILLIQIGRYTIPTIFWERMLLGNILTTLFIFVFLYIGNSYAYIFVSPSRNRFKNLSESFNPSSCKLMTEEEESEELYRLICEYMEKEKPYIRGQLTLKEIADRLGRTQLSVSQAVNAKTGRNISDFINGYRVELLKKYLADPAKANFKIMVLADECGFSSKTSLIRVFKQHTGQTPSEYQKSVSNRTGKK